MTVRVSGKHIDVGDSLRTNVQTRTSAAIAKYFAGSVSGHVIFERDGTGFRTECTLHLSSGMTLQAEGRAHDVHACWEQAAERLEKRLRRYKRRLKDHHADSDRSTAAAAMVANYVIEPPDQDLDDVAEYSPVTIAEPSTRLKQLSVSDAVAELELTGAPLVFFRNAGHGRLNAVYQRPDGNIGWLDPEASA